MFLNTVKCEHDANSRCDVNVLMNSELITRSDFILLSVLSHADHRNTVSRKNMMQIFILEGRTLLLSTETYITVY